MDGLLVPLRQVFQNGQDGGQCLLGGFGGGLHLFAGEQLDVIVGQRIDEIHLLRDVAQRLTAGLQYGAKLPQVGGLALYRPADPGQRLFVEFLGGKRPDVLTVDVAQLLHIKDGRALGDAGNIKDLYQLLQREDLPIPLGAPAQQGDVVEDGRSQKAHLHQILIGGVAVALGELVGGIPHDGCAVDILGDLPAEGLIQQVVLGGGGKIFVAADDVGDAHGVVVHHVGKVVGGHPVPLDEDLIIQRAAIDGHIAVHLIVEGHGPLGRHLLPDDIGNSRRQLFGYFLLGKVAAVAVIAGRNAGGLLHLAHLLQPLLIAEAVVGVAAFHQLFGVCLKHIHPLALDIGAHGSADIGTLIPQKAGLLQRLVDDLHGALYLTLLVGVLYPQQKTAVIAFGHQIGKQRSAEIAHVHIAGGAGRKTGAYMVKLEHNASSFILKIS